MRTFLTVNAVLLPVIAFMVAAPMGHALPAAIIGLGFAVVRSVTIRRWRMPPPFEGALVAGLALIALAQALGIQAGAEDLTAVLWGALSAGAAASLLLGRPWTAEYSAAEYGGASASPLFRQINWKLSALWAALFAYLAAAELLNPGPWAHWLPVVVGAALSIALPPLLMRKGLQAMAAGDRRNDWEAPAFDGAVPVGGDDVVDVAVVGAGVGGLAAAALIADSGLKVAVYEHHVVPGGFAHTWRRRTRDPETGARVDFRFDAGVHDVSGWRPRGPVRSLFQRLGIERRLRWTRLDHRNIIAGRPLDVPRDWRAYAEALATEFPHQAEGICALFEDIHTIYEGMFATADERGGIPGQPTTPERILAFAKAHPMAVEWMEQPWCRLLDRRVRDPQVRRWFNALSGYITDDPGRLTVMDMVPIFGYYFDGGHYPEGGSGRIADALVEAIEARGGRVHLKHAVREITSHEGAVSGLVVDGPGGVRKAVRAQGVVCNADLGLLRHALLRDPEAQAVMDRQLGDPAPACSAMGVFLGLRGELDLPPVINIEDSAGGVHMVLPSVVDPSCAPAGYSTVELVEIIDHEAARDWFPGGHSGDTDAVEAERRSERYADAKAARCEQLLARARQVIPNLDERIVYRNDASPVTYHRYSWTRDGAIYGVAWPQGRPPTRMPVRGLVLAGAATHGPGIEAVVISGAYAAEALVPGLLAREGTVSARPRVAAG